MSMDLEAPGPARSTSAKKAARRIKDGALKTAQSGRERLDQATGLARDLTANGRHHMEHAGKATAAHVRQKPLSTGLIVAGVVAGGALLLNPALRRMAIAAGPALWKMMQKARPPV